MVEDNKQWDATANNVHDSPIAAMTFCFLLDRDAFAQGPISYMNCIPYF